VRFSKRKQIQRANRARFSKSKGHSLIGAVKPIDNTRVLDLWARMPRMEVFLRNSSIAGIYLTLGGNHPKIPTASSTVKVKTEPGTSTNAISLSSGLRPLSHWWTQRA